MKLRAAWQRRSLAMDLAGLATFSVVESWVQYLFTHLTREQPRGFAKVTLNQLLEMRQEAFHYSITQDYGSPERARQVVTSHWMKSFKSWGPVMRFLQIPYTLSSSEGT